MYNDVKGSYA